MKLSRIGIVALIAIALAIGCAYVGRGVSTQPVKPAGAYAPQISGTIVEVNPRYYSLEVQLDEPCYPYRAEDRVTVYFSQFLWESNFNEQDAATVGSQISIMLYPMGSEESHLEAMHVLGRDNS